MQLTIIGSRFEAFGTGAIAVAVPPAVDATVVMVNTSARGVLFDLVGGNITIAGCHFERTDARIPGTAAVAITVPATALGSSVVIIQDSSFTGCM